VWPPLLGVPNEAEWFIRAEIHKEATRTRYSTGERMQTSYDMLSQRNSKNCLEEWVTDFTKGDFLTTTTHILTECPRFTVTTQRAPMTSHKPVKDTGNALPTSSPLFVHKLCRMESHPCSLGYIPLPTSPPALCCFSFDLYIYQRH